MGLAVFSEIWERAVVLMSVNRVSSYIMLESSAYISIRCNTKLQNRVGGIANK
jgi:hypothetical protein